MEVVSKSVVSLPGDGGLGDDHIDISSGEGMGETTDWKLIEEEGYKHYYILVDPGKINNVSEQRKIGILGAVLLTEKVVKRKSFCDDVYLDQVSVQSTPVINNIYLTGDDTLLLSE